MYMKYTSRFVLYYFYYVPFTVSDRHTHNCHNSSYKLLNRMTSHSVRKISIKSCSVSEILDLINTPKHEQHDRNHKWI